MNDSKKTITKVAWLQIISIYVLLLAFTAAGFTQDSPTQFTPYEQAIANFEAKIASDVAQDGIGGIVAGVVAGDKLVWPKGFGRADVEKRILNDAETIGRTGSISKSFTVLF